MCNVALVITYGDCMKQVFLPLLLLTSFSSFAQIEHPIDVELEACISDNSSTAGIGNCGSKAHEQWDAELNYYYKTLMNVLDSNQKSSLRESQRSWIKYRDLEVANIKSIYGSKRGSMWGLTALSDITEITKDRALALKKYFENIN